MLAARGSMKREGTCRRCCVKGDPFTPERKGKRTLFSEREGAEKKASPGPGGMVALLKSGMDKLQGKAQLTNPRACVSEKKRVVELDGCLGSWGWWCFPLCGGEWRGLGLAWGGRRTKRIVVGKEEERGFAGEQVLGRC